MPESLPGTKQEKPRLVDDPMHRSSRRRLGLYPEFSGLSLNLLGHATPPVVASSQVTFHQPRTPNTFHGDTFEDIEDWITPFERVASFNKCDDGKKRCNVDFVLEESDMVIQSPEKLEDVERVPSAPPGNLLKRIPLRPSAAFAWVGDTEAEREYRDVLEDMAPLFRSADPATPGPNKLRYLTHGVKEQLFGCLVWNPPLTVKYFLTEGAAIKRACTSAAAKIIESPPLSPSDAANIRTDESCLQYEIHSVLREELNRLVVTSQRWAPSPVRIVREEPQQVFTPPVPPTKLPSTS